MSSPRLRKWSVRIAVLFTVAAALYVGGSSYADSFLRKRLLEAIGQVGARIPDDAPFVLKVELYSATVSLHGLVLVPDPQNTDHALSVCGRVDTLEVRGVSLWQWFVHRSVQVDGLKLRVHGLQVSSCDTAHVDEAHPPQKRLKNISVRNFDIALRESDVLYAQGTGGELLCAQMHFIGEAFSIQPGKPAFWHTMRIEDPVLELTDFALRTDDLQEYKWAQVLWNGTKGTLRVEQLAFGPVLDLAEFSAGLNKERDVIKGSLAHVDVEGLEVSDLLATGAWSMRSLSVADGSVDVLRDKTLPDGRDTIKPLLTRTIRGFPEGSGVDTIRISDLDIRYNERAEYDRGYGVVVFTKMQALITGVRHRQLPEDQLRVTAECEAMDTAHVTFSYHAMIADTTDHFELEARMAHMQMKELNKATGPLAEFVVTEGYMDTLIFTMDGNDHYANGNVRLAYSGLKLAKGSRSWKAKKGSLVSRLLNTVVRNNGRDPQGKLHDGHYTIQRQRTHSAFNYLWISLREGVKEVMLPDVMTP